MSTWIKFAPILILYKAMSLSGQWYCKLFQKEQGAALVPYSINNTVFVVASPRLIQANLESYLTYWLFDASSLGLLRQSARLRPVAWYQVIVVDLAAEISSHIDKLEGVSRSIINAHLSSLPTTTMSISIQPSFYFHYLYLPLLDLQPLSDVLLKDYIDLFKQLEALTKPIETQCFSANEEDKTEGSPSEITLINFHCVMGLSRSIGVQVLYLVYCGKLTAHSYRFWIEQHYPHAQLAEAYLPQSLVEDIVNYRYNHINNHTSSPENSVILRS